MACCSCKAKDFPGNYRPSAIWRLIAEFSPEVNRSLIFYNLLFGLIDTFAFVTVTPWDILQH